MGASIQHVVRTVMLAVLCLLSGVALAETRVALVIGNGAYEGAPKLTNPSRDAATIAATLQAIGFDVRVEKDLGFDSMRKALRDFAVTASQADWAVVYFAGHGMEMGGQNYLIPTDARLRSDRAVPFETVALEQVMNSVEGARKLRLVILDACRNNPFLDQMTRTNASRAIGRGLARLEPDGGTLVAYAAKAGQEALDGDGQNSPFVGALAKAISTPGLEVNMVFRAVRDEVLNATSRRQEPFVYGSLPSESLYFVPREEKRPDDEMAWQAIQASGDAPAVEAFLQKYPRSALRPLAWARLAELQAADLRRRMEADKQAEEQAVANPVSRNPSSNPAVAARPAPAQIPAAPPQPAPSQPQAVAATDPANAQLAERIQWELRRVGCLKAEATAAWSKRVEQAVKSYNKNAGARLDVKVASLDSLEKLRSAPGNVCPLTCDAGQEIRNSQCVPIVCRDGTVLSSGGRCVAVQKPKATSRSATANVTQDPLETKNRATRKVVPSKQNDGVLFENESISGLGTKITDSDRARLNIKDDLPVVVVEKYKGEKVLCTYSHGRKYCDNSRCIDANNERLKYSFGSGTTSYRKCFD